ncbi:AGC family protein kinase [Trichomonas vaginalis G3]|uniref:non-specific serine/threonine protein kinase n=1 Tax=Trichomonas vaginalis (strain ATCC PRA-98 / G3) TaxID=412133 RepID=A2E6I9_TRIV3|nr:protein serine/threonine kinase protein [Trichomonas vaginalis G3]EAY11694.1 AGC family protein kinase [Trichomonas vaginalis G3]KAI5488870.1 protein serine/threonine kinase protein [Trichomonas vaginalis G3]|eukprot:XP_001323917.1 AGC family protein kinase [Trichomonas vaginalis G3]
MDDEEITCIPIGNYILRQRIGEGAFSSVWTADSKKTNSTVAVKVISKKTLEAPDMFTRFKREISLLQQNNHPFIMHFFEMLEDEKNYYVIMEYADNGDFETFLESKMTLPENMSRFFLAEMVLALDYLHNERRIAHRDLKPQNILLDRYNNIRISDFGLSNTFSDSNPTMTSNCGSPAFVAPEVVNGQPYNKSADIWSLGVIFYRMVVGNLPFQGPDVKTILMKIVSAEPYYPPSLSPDLRDLLQKMLCRNPEKRITAKEIKAHPWIIPEFVQELSNSIDSLREATSDASSPVAERDAVMLQKAREQLVYDLWEQVQTARTLLPTVVVHQPPHSLPSPSFPVNMTNKASRIPSSMDLKLKEPLAKPMSRQMNKSSANLFPKKRVPTKVPSLLV